LTGPRKRLRGTEAKTLASSILQPLFSKPSSATNPTKIINDEVLGIAISSCLGLTSAVGIGVGGPTGGVKRVECIRFRVGGDGYESPMDDDDDDAENAPDSGTIRETFDVTFAVSFGGLVGEWVAKGLSALAENEEKDSIADMSVSEERGEQLSNVAWKGKFLEAQRRLWEAQEEVKRLKDKVLEAVL